MRHFTFLCVLFATGLLTAQTNHRVEVRSNVFDPRDITIQVGDTITWENVNGFHNVNGTQDNYPDNPVGFGNGTASAPWTYQFVFDVEGFYEYQCDPHLFLGMVGTVIVESSSNINESVIITEIMYNPPESNMDSLEFIELYNPNTTAVDLSGWTMSAGFDLDFPAGTTIPAEDFLILCVDSAAFVNTLSYTGPTLQWTDGALSNGGETVAISNANGVVISEVSYDDVSPWPVEADGDGPSLQICDETLEENDPSNWVLGSTSTGVIINGAEILANPGALPACGLPSVPSVVCLPSSEALDEITSSLLYTADQAVHAFNYDRSRALLAYISEDRLFIVENLNESNETITNIVSQNYELSGQNYTATFNTNSKLGFARSGHLYVTAGTENDPHILVYFGTDLIQAAPVFTPELDLSRNDACVNFFQDNGVDLAGAFDNDQLDVDTDFNYALGTNQADFSAENFIQSAREVGEKVNPAWLNEDGDVICSVIATDLIFHRKTEENWPTNPIELFGGTYRYFFNTMPGNNNAHEYYLGKEEGSNHIVRIKREILGQLSYEAPWEDEYFTRYSPPFSSTITQIDLPRFEDVTQGGGQQSYNYLILNEAGELYAYHPLGEVFCDISSRLSGPADRFVYQSSTTVHYSVNNQIYALDMGDFVADEESIGSTSIRPLQWTSSIQLFPNPVAGLLEISSEIEIDEVVLFDTQGRRILSLQPHAAQVRLNIDHLNPGIYHVGLRSKGAWARRSIIKN